MRLFHLMRTEDPTGVSGTGKVAQGVDFGNHWVVLNWLSEHPSLEVFRSIEEVQTIHGHEGKTQVVFVATEPASAL